MSKRIVDIKELEVRVADLALGMQVTRLDRPWEETSFLLQGFVIDTPDQIHELQEQCDHVYIMARQVSFGASDPTSKRLKRKAAEASKSGDTANTTKPTKRRLEYINKIDVKQEMASARSIHAEAKQLANDIMDGIRIGRTIDMNRCKAVVDDCVDSILRNHNAMLWLSKIKNRDNYTAEHCLNVCLLSATFAKHLGLLEEEIRTIALSGLLHDVGKTRTPLEVLNKPGALTPEEYALVRKHATHGRDILMSTPNSEHITVDVAFCHHERIDGKGYPRGIKGHQIPYFAQIVSIVDTYDAITSNRVYDNGRASYDALDIIYTQRGKQFDEELANEFIQCVGIFPPGSIVEMNSGEVGIVVDVNPKSKRKPRVILVLDAEKQPREKQRVIDLADDPESPCGDVYAIIKELPNGSHGVDLKAYQDDGLMIGHQTVSRV